MHRLRIITVVAAFALPATAGASVAPVYDDCQDNGRMDRRYPDRDLRDALREMPEDLDEYTNCRELIRGALNGVDTTGGGGGGAPAGLPEGNGAGSVPVGPTGKPLNPLIDAQPNERHAIGRAASGESIRPTTAGVRPGAPDGSLPTPLVAVLVLIGLGVLSAAGWGLKSFVGARLA